MLLVVVVVLIAELVSQQANLVALIKKFHHLLRAKYEILQVTVLDASLDHIAQAVRPAWDPIYVLTSGCCPSRGSS